MSEKCRDVHLTPARFLDHRGAGLRPLDGVEAGRLDQDVA
jgi:hypothetical protein